MVKQLPTDDPAKGKTILSWESNYRLKKMGQKEKVAAQQPWRKPPERWVKLNIDGSFYGESNSGGAGIVLRDETWAILVSACAFLQACQDAKLEACRQGAGLALEWSNNPCVIEMDCSEAVKMISSETLDRLPYSAIISSVVSKML
jgi:hypothetical protein